MSSRGPRTVVENLAKKTGNSCGFPLGISAT
jgi:hypothetical protein